VTDPRTQRPAEDEYAPFYARYVSRVADGDVVRQLEAQDAELAQLLGGLDEARAAHSYAPDKWSIKQMVGHLADTERIMTYRLLRIARGDATPLPGFDENAYADHAASDARTLADLLAEWRAVRAATLPLLAGLPAEAWGRTGSANGHAISARALAWIVAGHVTHHVAVLHERYL
jgi:hypothetical protein